ncbi:acyl carrier protein [Streptomyces lavendulae]
MVQLTSDLIRDRIFHLLKQNAKIDPNELALDANFVKDLKLDDLDRVEIVTAVGEEFSIEIPDSDAEEIKSVKDAVHYVLLRQDAN